MASSFLDKIGLADVVSRIKALIATRIHNQAVTTEGTGAAYTATVEGITALTAGATFVMIPHTASTSKTPTLNVNGLGAKTLRRRLSNSTVSTVAAATENWLGANKPIRVFYDGTYWIADFTRPNANDIYGTVAVASGGTGASTAATALTNLGAQAQHHTVVVNLGTGSWVDNQQTVSVQGVTANNTIVVSAAIECKEAYAEAGVYCSSQADGTLTFTCENVPSDALMANVAILN